METELKSLRIDRNKRRGKGGSAWASRWIVAGIVLFLLAGAGVTWSRLNAGVEVQTAVVPAPESAGPAGAGGDIVLDATGYIVAAHKIEVASKVVGRVAWIGVDKGDKVREGQVIVRLEDDEYRAQLTQAEGQLASLRARLAELKNGSRPEEIARAQADVEQAKADLDNARISLNRTRQLVNEGVLAKATLDDAQARFTSQEQRVRSLERTYELAKIGPRRETIDQVDGNIKEAQGRVSYFQTQLANTQIKAPVTGTILERNVEKGEFVTTGFVGENGAKGYVVSLTDLNDLEVELDINQNDFAKLRARQNAVVTTDAYPDRKYQGVINEISPEANRQKATVQVKVKIMSPDEYLRPEMNATVRFIGDRQPSGPARQPAVVIPTSALRGDAVFLLDGDKVRRRTVRPGAATPQGTRIEGGLSGGERIVLNPPEGLKDGDKVKGGRA